LAITGAFFVKNRQNTHTDWTTMCPIEKIKIGEVQMTEKKYTSRHTLIDAIILHRLMDGEVRTQRKRADRVEVSAKTIQRSIERLRILYVTAYTAYANKEKSSVPLDF
jgi:hypothetical protein